MQEFGSRRARRTPRACGCRAPLRRWMNSRNGTCSPLQRPTSFNVNYSLGNHWGLWPHSEYTAFYVFGISYKYDHTFSNFGSYCLDCGPTYGTGSLQYGSVVGGYHGHPRADNGSGMDHRQILVDMQL